MGTLDFYNENANDYFEKTINLNMDIQYNLFEKYLNSGSRILDFGCGSGRDTKHFLDKGFNVDAIDGSSELVRLASEFTHIDVKCMDFYDFNELNLYDGIWACASLLHIPKSDFKSILIKLSNALKSNGILYVAVKNGSGESVDNKGRLYNYMSKDEFENEIKGTNLELIEFVIHEAQLNSEESFYSFILRRM